MRNLLLVLEYDGLKFAGWQRQKGLKTVQGTLEKLLGEILGEEIQCIGSGRTDALVHAVGQVVNFYTNSSLPEKVIAHILNMRGDSDFRVVNVLEVPLHFHARKHALQKWYRYVLSWGSHLPVFWRGRVAFLGNITLDMQRMMEGSRIFLGTHDFTSFSSPGSTVGSKVRTIFSFDFREKSPFFISLDIRADGFLYHMVRFLVGELIMLGMGKRTIHELTTMLTHPSHCYPRFNAPPEGLYLVQVAYREVDPYQGLTLEEDGFVVPLWRTRPHASANDLNQ